MVKKRLSAHIGRLCICSFLLLTAVWFAFARPAAFAYEEQFHLFLFTPDYFLESLRYPGGAANWLAELFTQFYFQPILGAFMMIAVYAMLTELSKRFIPVVALFWLCKLSLQLPCALLIALAIYHIYINAVPQKTMWQFILLLILIPVTYYLSGCGVFVFLLCVLLNPATAKMPVYAKIVSLIYCLLIPWLATYVFAYPTDRLFLGINDMTYTGNIKWTYIAVLLAFPLADIAGRWKVLQQKWFTIPCCLAVAVTAVIVIRNTIRPEQEEIFAYDQMARYGQWDELIARASHSPSRHPLLLIPQNLALAERGLLHSHLDQYPQQGVYGLLCDTGQERIAPFCAIEAYYHIGMTETAKRAAFELQESIPSHRKSGRCMVMLAKTNIIGDNLQTAKKYLTLLTHSLYYSRWAASALALIENGTVDQAAEFATMRTHQIQSDDMVFFDETGRWLETLCQKDPTNVVASEYLYAWKQLTK